MNPTQSIFDIFRQFVEGANEIWKWLNTTLFTWGDDKITPLMIFTWGGLAVVIAILLIHFLNVVS